MVRPNGRAVAGDHVTRRGFLAGISSLAVAAVIGPSMAAPASPVLATWDQLGPACWDTRPHLTAEAKRALSEWRLERAGGTVTESPGATALFGPPGTGRPNEAFYQGRWVPMSEVPNEVLFGAPADVRTVLAGTALMDRRTLDFDRCLTFPRERWV